MRTECQAHVHSDIVVCGGGPAGIMAAVSAARMGCKVSIIEHFGFFGGAATACLVVPISGFFKNGERVVGGLPWEFISELIRLKFPGCCGSFAAMASFCAPWARKNHQQSWWNKKALA